MGDVRGEDEGRRMSLYPSLADKEHEYGQEQLRFHRRCLAKCEWFKFRVNANLPSAVAIIGGVALIINIGAGPSRLIEKH